MTTDPQFSAVRYLPTSEAYDRWASVYDTDGNFLQAIDVREMRSLLPRFEAAIQTRKPWKLVDLGCGTGRNTVLLLGIEDANTVALDASLGMLEVAKNKVKEFANVEAVRDGKIQLEKFDLMTSDPPAIARGADGIISTLVLEHIPLETFFKHAAQMLKLGGVLLLTNMHSEMGSISQAGFVDAETGEKIRPTSYAHRIEDVVNEASKWGFNIVPGNDYQGSGTLKEVTVTEDMVEDLGPRSGKWIGVACWFGGLFVRTSARDDL